MPKNKAKDDVPDFIKNAVPGIRRGRRGKADKYADIRGRVLEDLKAKKSKTEIAAWVVQELKDKHALTAQQCKNTGIKICREADKQLREETSNDGN